MCFRNWNCSFLASLFASSDKKFLPPTAVNCAVSCRRFHRAASKPRRETALRIAPASKQIYTRTEEGGWNVSILRFTFCKRGGGGQKQHLLY